MIYYKDMAEEIKQYNEPSQDGRKLYAGAFFCLCIAGIFFILGATIFFRNGSFIWSALCGATAFLFFALALRLIWIITQAFEKMKKISERVDAIIANLADGLVEIDTERRILRANPRAEELLLFRSERVINTPPPFGIISKSKDDIFGFLAAVIAEAGSPPAPLPSAPLSKELVLGQSPRELFLEISFVPIKEKDGSSSAGIFILRDITREKIIGRIKSEFISIAAHQLRTPLSGVKWALRLFLDGDLGEITQKQRDFLEKAYGTNERMILLVGDLLNVSRIEEGRFGYEFSTGDLAQFLKEIAGEFLSRMQEKKLQYVFGETASLPPAIFDREKLRLALFNVLDNAIEYTPPGGIIKITFDYTPPYIRIAVQDTGVGIPPHQVSRLFTKFFRGDNVVRMQTEGTGLGLFIVKNIILAHGGDAWIDSELGKGTTVFMTIPTNRALIPAVPPMGE